MTAWGYLPAAMLVGAFLMTSNPTPKLGKLVGFARVLPELMAIMPTTWLAVSLVWGQVSRTARAVPPPTFLPAETVDGKPRA